MGISSWAPPKDSSMPSINRIVAAEKDSVYDRRGDRGHPHNGDRSYGPRAGSASHDPAGDRLQ